MGIIDTHWPGTGSHQPLIKAVMELYLPGFILELGVGLYSTPVFLNYKTKYMGVENDLTWVDHMKEKYNINILHHNLPDVTIWNQLKDLTEAQRTNICLYYKNLKVLNIHPRLLFVDQWASCRVLSINTIGNKFDLIIYHDSESAGSDFNYYNLIELKGFKKYTLRSSNAWTTLLVKNDKGFDLLNEKILSYIADYKLSNNENYMELENNS